ncbi:MAG TPA: hypothetical protein DCW46_02685 [Desulfotomaculum sp.]|nr:hypothetical protein [Desulfotomaculum sp.]
MNSNLLDTKIFPKVPRIKEKFFLIVSSLVVREKTSRNSSKIVGALKGLIQPQVLRKLHRIINYQRQHKGDNTMVKKCCSVCNGESYSSSSRDRWICPYCEHDLTDNQTNIAYQKKLLEFSRDKIIKDRSEPYCRERIVFQPVFNGSL